VDVSFWHEFRPVGAHAPIRVVQWLAHMYAAMCMHRIRSPNRTRVTSTSAAGGFLGMSYSEDGVKYGSSSSSDDYLFRS